MTKKNGSAIGGEYLTPQRVRQEMSKEYGDERLDERLREFIELREEEVEGSCADLNASNGEKKFWYCVQQSTKAGWDVQKDQFV